MKPSQKAASPSVAFIVILLSLAVGETLSAQAQQKVDLDSYYHAPLAFGATYLPLAGIGNRQLADFDVQEISGELRLSPGWLPVLQPFLRGGMLNYAYVGDLDEAQQDWTHSHLYAGLGLGYATRLSREFELGFEGFGGASQSFFNELVVDGETVPQGQLNIVGGASARLALNPSYNVSVSVTPAVRYLYGLGPLATYDGLVFGVGFGLNYRLGQDPDAPQSAVRALRFGTTALPPLFAAMRSYYARKPAGTITITNTEKYAITEVQASFMQAGFMDSPTPCMTIESLAPGQSVDVPVLASFNDQVFSTQGVTAVTGELIVQYAARGKPVEQRQSVTYDLYDKNSLTWDDDRKVAAFITPQDSAIRNFASFIRQASKEATNPFLSANLQFAMQAYGALTELGLFYQIDPTSPFTQAQEDSVVVDSVSLPRETLARRTGDCDDLTVLYNSLLQSVGIQTALVTIPGHIYSAFNTGVASQKFLSLHPDRNMLLDVDGELWVLVEITMIGQSDFLKAWNTGISEFRRYDGDTRVRGFYRTADAQEIYRSVPLRESDLGLQYGEPAHSSKRFTGDLQTLQGIMLQATAERAKAAGTVKDWMAYGVAAAQLGSTAQARQAFEAVIRLDPANISATLNLGSIHYLNEDYKSALVAYSSAQKAIEAKRTVSKATQFNLFVNLSKTYNALGQPEQSRDFYARASDVDAAQAARFSYLGSSGGSTGAASTGSPPAVSGRASEAGSAEPILFADE